ncbi:MAG: helix-turn-helix domain-containing protein [Halioglobus sp.]
MLSDDIIIASGNLGTPRRTIMGVLGQCALFELDEQRTKDIFTSAGLPARALEALDFPISLEQELLVCHALLQTLADGRSPICTVFGAMNNLGIENLAVLGMAMRHSDTAIDALKVCLTFPQLTGGHSRMLVKQQHGEMRLSFTMKRPSLRNVEAADIDKLVQYCVVLDLVSSLRNIDGLVMSNQVPLSITLPFEEPDDWSELNITLPCPVNFCGEEASFAYIQGMEREPLPHANPLLYRSYVAIAEKQSQMLAEEFSLQERVSRWLWAYSPPPDRRETARLLAMSERNLTRQLAREDTSFSQLTVQVQTERAKNFLADSTLSIAEISHRLGYAEPAAFSRAFSTWTGLPPGRWRKNTH